MTKPTSIFRLFLLLSFAAMSASLTVACAEEDRGGRGQPCREDYSCDEGLQCHAEESNICGTSEVPPCEGGLDDAGQLWGLSCP